jgi:peroxiredoxin
VGSVRSVRTVGSAKVFADLTALTVLTAPTVEGQIRGVLVDAPEVGRRAPALILPYVTSTGVGAGAYELRQELGRTVVLAFCGRVEEPGCVGLWTHWRGVDTLYGAGVSAVAITSSLLAEARAFAEGQASSGRLLVDERGTASRRWGVAGGGGGDWLAVYVVSEDGTVAYRDLQFHPDDLHAQRRLQAAAAAARRPPPGP